MSQQSSYPMITIAVVLVASWKRILRHKLSAERWNTNRIADALISEGAVPEACFTSCDRNAIEKALAILDRTESTVAYCATIKALGGQPSNKEKPHGINAGTILLKHALGNTAREKPEARAILVVSESSSRLRRMYRELKRCSFANVPALEPGNSIIFVRFTREQGGFHKFQDIWHRHAISRVVPPEALTSAPP